jgi:hypothetical protein
MSEPCQGNCWFETDSNFYNQLKEKLKHWPLDIRSFLWSGANSVFARDRAATKLAEELSKVSKDVMPVIIAHSYGGNAALRALEYLREDNIDVSRVKIVTLATPFLKVFVRDSSEISGFTWLLVWGAISIFCAIPMVPFILTAIAMFGGGTDLMYWGAGLGLVLALVASICIVLWLANVFGNRTRAKEIERAANYPSIDASGPRMLVIRGVDDEASLTLAAGSIGSRLSSRALILISMSVSFVLVVLAFVIFVMTLAGWSLPKEWDYWLPLIMGACALSALAILFLPGIYKSGFGREFLTMGFLCEIAADSTPDTVSRIDSTTVSSVEEKKRRSLRLRHFIYEHSSCVEKIVTWKALGLDVPRPS